MTLDAVRLAIFVVTYGLIAAQGVPAIRVNRPAAALLGAVGMVTLGGLPLRDAYAAIDLDVITFLLGVLLVTAHLEIGNFFEWAGERVVRRARTPRAILAAVIVLAGVLSAFFVNDTLCLVLTPLVIAALAPLGLPPLPYLLAVALASNVGSALAITGNPQNMLVGVASGIPFGRFLVAMAVPALGGLAIVYAVVAWVYRAQLAAAVDTRAAAAVADAAPVDWPLVATALAVFGVALVAWLAGLSMPLVAITAGAVMLALSRRDPTPALARVEWSLLLFFAALFVVMRGVEGLPLVRAFSDRAACALTGAPWHDAAVAGGAMVVLSNLVSNVPAVILWLPVVPRLANREFVWLVVSLASTLAGNLTLLGSIANLIVAERAKARGVIVGFREHLRVGIPVTVLTLAWGLASLDVVHAMMR